MSTATAIKVKGIDIHAYLAKDPDRAKKFYRDVIGLVPTTDVPQGAEYELPDGSTFGVWYLEDGSWHPSAGVFFAVDDVDKAVEAYKANGVAVLMGPEHLPHCDMAVCEDSEGNSFIIHHRKI